MEINFNYNSDFESLFQNLFIECENESNDCQSINHSFDDNFENITHFEEEIIERNYNLKESDININLSKTKFNDLNDYCFLHLFSFLNFYQLMKLRIVCNKWKYNIDEYLKTKRNLKLINSLTNQTINTDIDMESINSSAFRQNCLTIIANDSNCDNILSLMTKLCPKLISLEFIYVIIDEKIVSNLTKNFYDVNHLCFAHPLHVTEDLIKLVINYFGPQLKSLIIVDCDITEECLESIIKQCPNLETLDLSQNADITGESFQYLSNNLVTLRLSQCDSIEELGLNSMVKSTASHSISHLTISGMISDYMIRIIGQNMPNLKSFNCVYGCTRDFGSQTDHLSFVSLLRRLEKLSLQEVDAYYGSLDDRSLLSIMQSCNALKYLEIHVGSGEQLLVSDKSLSLIANYCSLIESLKIYYIETITDRSLNAFSKLKHLKELELINLYNIKDEGVVIITELCTNLTKLSISFDGYCDSITNITLSACIEMSRKRPKHCIEVNFFETSISVPFNLVIPMNMRLRVSWYRQTPEGRRYTQIKLPNNAIQTLYH